MKIDDLCKPGKAILLALAVAGTLPAMASAAAEAAVTAAAAAAPADQVDKKAKPKRYVDNNVTWRGGQYLTVCADETRLCSNVKMSKEIGKVEQVVVGPLIEGAQASWIAVSKFESFVCAALKDSKKVVCAKVQAARFPLAHARMAFLTSADGETRFAMAPAPTTVDKEGHKRYAKAFRAALRETSMVLKGEVDNFSSLARGSDFASTLSVCDNTDPGPPPHPDCTLVDNMWSCPITGPGTDPDPGPGPDPWPWPDPDPTPDPDPDC